MGSLSRKRRMPPAFCFLRLSLSSVRSRGMANEWLRREEIGKWNSDSRDRATPMTADASAGVLLLDH